MNVFVKIVDDIVVEHRLDGEPQPLFALGEQLATPSLGQKAHNLARAAGRVAKAAVKREKIAVSADEQERRLAICKGCEYFKPSTLSLLRRSKGCEGRNSQLSTCNLCGCALNLKTRLATEHCPIGKW